MNDTTETKNQNNESDADANVGVHGVVINRRQQVLMQLGIIGEFTAYLEYYEKVHGAKVPELDDHKLQMLGEESASMIDTLCAIFHGAGILPGLDKLGKFGENIQSIEAAFPLRHERPTDCSGDSNNCPENEGHGCFCSDRAAL